VSLLPALSHPQHVVPHPIYNPENNDGQFLNMKEADNEILQQYLLDKQEVFRYLSGGCKMALMPARIKGSLNKSKRRDWKRRVSKFDLLASDFLHL
jgi:hypothetical protein